MGLRSCRFDLFCRRFGCTRLFEFSKIFGFLIKELKDTFNDKLNIINEKLSLVLNENRQLKKENEELRKISAKPTQETKMQNISENTQTHRPTEMKTQNRSNRGIRNNNLILTGLDCGTQDPKIAISEFLSKNFNVKNNMLIGVRQIGQTGGPISATSKFLLTFKSVWDVSSIHK